MNVKLLGTGTATPSLKRLSSSYLVGTEWGNILIDMGPSVVRRLLEFGHVLGDIDMIILTHFHPDHSVDLPTFLFACNYGGEARSKPLFLLGGRGVKMFYRKLARLYPWIEPIGYELTIKAMSTGTLKTGQISVTTAPLNHRDESIGVRIEEKDHSVVFSGDTDYCPELVTLVSGADVFISECSFPERKVEGHLNLALLRRIVAEARPRQVIMSHLYPEWETFQAALPPPLLLGEDGIEITVN